LVKNTALLIVALLLSGLLIEVGLRSAGFVPRVLTPNRFFVDGTNTTWSVPDEELGWINREGVSVSIEEGAAPMTFWSSARRASRADPAPPADRVSLMVVGGSNAQSYGVRDEDSFPFLLAERHPNLWVENFGNGGFGTAQALLLTERVLRDFYQDRPPQLIILTFADSHIARNVSDQSWVYSISDSQGRYVSPPHFRLNGDSLFFQPFKTIGLWPLETGSALVSTLHHIWLQSISYATADQGVAVTRLLLDRFAGVARANGSDILVAVLEDYGQVAGAVFSDAEYPVIDCSGFERTAPKDYLLGGGSHPNERGHAHFAECIGRWLGEYLNTDSVPERP
jgi:hypothetical protein